MVFENTPLNKCYED